MWVTVLATQVSLLAGRYALGGAAALPDEELPVKRRVSGFRGFHWRLTLPGMIRNRVSNQFVAGALAMPGATSENLAPGRPRLAGSRRSTTRGVKKFGGEIDHAGQLPVGESGF